MIIKNWKRSLAIPFLALSLQACEKQDAGEVNKQNFSIEYHFINQGDTNVRDVVLSTFQTVTVFNQIKKLDTVGFSKTKTPCIACVDYLKVFVRFEEMQYSTLAAAKGYNNGGSSALGMVRGKTYLVDTVSIASGINQTLLFKWPSDTLKYKELIY
ncbi:MAG TPA: hypothetical protein VM935_12770 [Chitinophagaceae bacterium]|nr:hypothetical protein [Chitinophagaceae bacterium]